MLALASESSKLSQESTCMGHRRSHGCKISLRPLRAAAMGAKGWRYREDHQIVELVVYVTAGFWLPEPLDAGRLTWGMPDEDALEGLALRL